MVYNDPPLMINSSVVNYINRFQDKTMKEIFDNEDMNQEDFSKMLEESLKAKDDFAPGDKISGTIVLINDESTFLSLTGKSEAVIDTAELRDKEGNIKYKKGDTIEAWIVSMKRGETKVTLRIGKGNVNSELLLTAYQNMVPLEGVATGEIKGGFNVNVSGFRCFCPYSQIDIKSSEDRAQYINKNFSFRILEYKENGKNIILSRRALLEEKQQQREDEAKKTLQTGDITEGTVASVKDFGIFVDLKGIEGFVPKSEISWSRNAGISQYKTGDKISAKIINLDWPQKKITLSIKQLTDEPWNSIDRFSEGLMINGRVSNIIQQGAFIEIAPGIEGYIHVSRMSVVKNIHKPEDAVTLNDMVNVRILSIDKENKRIALELVTGEADPWQEPVESLTSETHIAVIENVRNNGITARLKNGMQGYIPRNELSDNTDIQKKYRTGSEIKVVIKDMDIGSRKMILSEKNAFKLEEEKEFKSFMNAGPESSSSSLGNLFRDKFENIKKQVK